MIDKYFELLNQKKGERNKIKEQIKSTKEKLIKSKKDLISIEKAQSILQEVSKQTQEQIKFHIEDIVTMAIETVFTDNLYEFKLDFVVKRNKVECELYLERDGYRFDIEEANGGGMVDLVSFALRIALWSLKIGEKNNTIILDEPFKFISKDLIDKAGKILQELSKKLGIQFIIVTHIQQLVEYGGKVFEVVKKNNISLVKEL